MVRRCSIAWRTTMCANWLRTRSSMRSMPDPDCRGITVVKVNFGRYTRSARRTSIGPIKKKVRRDARTQDVPRPRPRPPPCPRAEGISIGSPRSVLAAQSRRCRQCRRRIGIERNRHPGGQDQSCCARSHRSCSGRDRGDLGFGGAAGGHHSQLLRRAHGSPTLDCLRARSARCDQALYLWFRACGGFGRTVRTRHDRTVGSDRRCRGGETIDQPGRDRAPRLGSGGRFDRFHRKRIGGVVSDQGRQANRFSGPGG